MEKFYEEELKEFDTYEAANNYRHEIFSIYNTLPDIISYKNKNGNMTHSLRFSM